MTTLVKITHTLKCYCTRRKTEIFFLTQTFLELINVLFIFLNVTIACITHDIFDETFNINFRYSRSSWFPFPLYYPLPSVNTWLKYLTTTSDNKDRKINKTKCFCVIYRVKRYVTYQWGDKIIVQQNL